MTFTWAGGSLQLAHSAGIHSPPSSPASSPACALVSMATTRWPNMGSLNDCRTHSEDGAGGRKTPLSQKLFSRRSRPLKNQWKSTKQHLYFACEDTRRPAELGICLCCPGEPLLLLLLLLVPSSGPSSGPCSLLLPAATEPYKWSGKFFPQFLFN